MPEPIFPKPEGGAGRVLTPMRLGWADDRPPIATPEADGFAIPSTVFLTQETDGDLIITDPELGLDEVPNFGGDSSFTIPTMNGFGSADFLLSLGGHPAAENIFAHRFTAKRRRVSKISIVVSSAAVPIAGDQMDLGIYSNDGATRLTHSGAIAIGTLGATNAQARLLEFPVPLQLLTPGTEYVFAAWVIETMAGAQSAIMMGRHLNTISEGIIRKNGGNPATLADAARYSLSVQLDSNTLTNNELPPTLTTNATGFTTAREPMWAVLGT